ncbi:hypothetical protein [Haloprofundus sp. MHR1]|uniref:DUF7511 domain-containing protein n=1 Tax=Haloprofundus sp. MHR1 TaxID=2572921 RepID=UPI0010BF0849|nr:hypothetical protein [Haloprofundus sp. MHR1]QCJ48215.1 hypothetical protein FCF25_14265 [Haloprofundus sp. MHR1]
MSLHTSDDLSDVPAAHDYQLDGRSFGLHSVTVRYGSGPDRCTIYPRDTPVEERVTVWLTADRDAFVGLEEMR